MWQKNDSMISSNFFFYFAFIHKYILQTFVKDICEIHAATILQILTDITENLYLLPFLLPRPGFEPAFFYRWCRRRLLLIQSLILMASLASFFDDGVDGAPIRCQKLRPEQCDDDVMMML